MTSRIRHSSEAAVLFGIEWPTVLVWSLCWIFWGLLCWHHAAMHPLIFIILSSMVAGWHGSFQHEAIHGHPTRWERINRLMASPGIALWLPFEDYRTSHLAHHVNENLTDPDRDPESYYVWQSQWEAMGGFRRWIMLQTNTLVGRLTIGSTLMILKCAWSHGKLMIQGDRKTWAVMLRHMAFSLPPALVALFVFNVPLWLYFIGFQFGAAFWMSLRSFLEHEAAENVGRRTAMVFDRVLPPTAWFTGFFSLIFLNNNLHVAHHLEPRLPWYALPRFVHENYHTLVTLNEGNIHTSYGAVAAKYGLRRKEPIAHPHSNTVDH